MEKKQLICIGCPMGCELTVTVGENQKIQVSGNTCIRGEQYAVNEMTNPKRMVTSTVPVIDGELPMVSVKTAHEIPKGKIMECMALIHELSVKAPVLIGDVLLSDIAGTGIPIVATKSVALRKDIV